MSGLQRFTCGLSESSGSRGWDWDWGRGSIEVGWVGLALFQWTRPLLMDAKSLPTKSLWAQAPLQPGPASRATPVLATFEAHQMISLL